MILYNLFTCYVKTYYSEFVDTFLKKTVMSVVSNWQSSDPSCVDLCVCMVRCVCSMIDCSVSVRNSKNGLA